MEIVLSFAQDYEDIILYNMLKDINEPIRYVDVGANHPISISVTKFFYDRGGSGINIEPQHDMIELLDIDRPRDRNIEAGAGNENGQLTLYGSGTGASFIESPSYDNGNYSKIVPIVTLKSILDDFWNKDADIHFLKIDVEGWEKSVLEGMDFEKYRPYVVIMESTIPDTNMPAWDEWENILINSDYVFVGMEAQNRYYVSREQFKRKELFLKKDELEKVYRIIMYPEAIGGARFYRSLLSVYRMKVMKPLRMVREWRKKRNNRQNVMFGE